MDTNILLYARDRSEPDKQPLAEALMRELWDKRAGRLSIQVLNEYFVNATQKLNPGLSRSEAWSDIEVSFRLESKIFGILPSGLIGTSQVMAPPQFRM